MSFDRREILRLLAAAGPAAALGSTASSLGAQQANTQQTASGSIGFDSDAASFWSELFQRAHSETLGSSQSGDERSPRFFVHTSKEGFRVPMSPPLQATELETIDRPSVKLRILTFKPSQSDSREIDSSQSGTLRVDLLQSGMLNSDQPGNKASTAVSGLLANGSSKLQPGSVSGLAIGGEEAFSLPGGGGYLNWSFFTQKKDAQWHKVLSVLFAASKVAVSSFMPVLSLGNLAKSSWNGVNSLIGGLMPAPNSAQTAARSTFWVFTPGLLQVAASQKAYQDPMFADGVPLIKGAHYVVVPQQQYKAFGDVMDKMMFTPSGYIVPQSTKLTDVYEAAYNTPELNDISYLSFHCEAISETTEPCAAAKPAKPQET